MRNLDRTNLVLAGSLALLLLISGGSYFIWGNHLEEQVLFFPSHQNAEVKGEARLLPRKKTTEKSIELLVRELFLGPFSIDYMPVVPRDSKIRSILLRDGTLYLDFNIDIVFQESASSLSLEESLDYISRSVTFNFPKVRKIIYSVNGNQLQLTSESAGD